MLKQLNAAATAGTIKITHLYVGHVKKADDRKVLAHAETMAWETAEPSIRAIVEQHLYQAIEGAEGVDNFPCMYTDEVLSVARVAGEDFDRTRNCLTVEKLQAIRDIPPDEFGHKLDEMIEHGNTVAYKVLAAGAIKNLLVAIVKFSIVPQLGAAHVHFSFATLVELEDRHDAFFDEMKGKFVTTELHNIIKRAKVARAAFFPCLGDDGRETADLLVYASGAAGPWFRALEMTPRLSPEKEGKALLKMIAEQTVGAEASPDLFAQLFYNLRDRHDPERLHVTEMITGLEKALGMGIDRLGFQARWESSFGGIEYRPQFASLFGGEFVDPPVLKVKAGEIEIKLPVDLVVGAQQFKWNESTYMLLPIPQQAKITVGADLDIRLKLADIEEIRNTLRRS